MKDFKDFIAGIGEINVIAYLIYICSGLAPLFHILIIGSELSTGKVVVRDNNIRKSRFNGNQHSIKLR
ncbi:hypothetical protein HMPREF2837_09955 [Streptococcus sp. HMSC071D03]|uniref:hypothetical protein n=1 Tax=Streptococcus sp. HMSC071D03 TaxID=1739341 RepID=UPI0008B23F6F|nr:hypothetical protein [Streptococcus sp. HMSC071D03]OFK02110.1 hypothetical protein HMPREF2837_09955 [Streptococcus sp. HMSC071D03]